jgi:hypothetical protein
MLLMPKIDSEIVKTSSENKLKTYLAPRCANYVSRITSLCLLLLLGSVKKQTENSSRRFVKR